MAEKTVLGPCQHTSRADIFLSTDPKGENKGAIKTPFSVKFTNSSIKNFIKLREVELHVPLLEFLSHISSVKTLN